MTDYRSLLVTTDFSPRALPGVAAAGELARRFGADLVLLHVVVDDLPPLLAASEEQRREILEQHRERAETHLDHYASQYLGGQSVETCCRVGTPARVIVEEARQRAVDLLVMATHGYGPLRQVLLGSTTERVLHHAPCPVLVVPSP